MASSDLRSKAEELIKAARNAGWRVKESGGHTKIFPPVIVIPSTPSDYRAIENLKSLLKKAGLDV